jgi:hypothetical protein
MLMFVLIGLSLVLAGLAGLQFTYLYYADRMMRERRKHIKQVEQRCARLVSQLEAAEARVKQQDELLEAAYPGIRKDGEVWADVIEER